MNQIFKAPDGKVYDWAEPHTAIIINEDGTKTETVEHLYAKYLSVGRRDDIRNYILVDDPRRDR